MTIALQSPFRRGGELTQVGPRLYKRQLLPRGQTITYRQDGEERQIAFDDPMLRTLLASWRAQAYDQVPFLLDPGGPKPHDFAENPEQYRGEVKGFELAKDGLDMFIETTPRGSALIDENPKLGVSARIVEDYDRADGKHFPLAIKHVLGTLDPQLTGMKPWVAADLASGQAETLVDLTSAHYEGEDMPENEPWQPSDEEKAALKELPGLVAALKGSNGNGAGGDSTGGTTPEGQPWTPEEEAEYLRSIGIDPDTGEELDPALAGAGAGGGDLSGDQAKAIDLINAQRAKDAERIASLEIDLANQRWEKEADEWGRKGVPTVVLDLAKPLVMAGSGTIDLGPDRGTFVPAEQVRKMLDAMPKLDMSNEHPLIEPDQSGGAGASEGELEAMLSRGKRQLMAGYDAAELARQAAGQK